MVFNFFYLPQIQSESNGIVRLLIKQARPKDAGVYTCRIYNSAGSVKSTANLVVKSMLISTSEVIPLPLFTTLSTPPTPSSASAANKTFDNLSSSVPNQNVADSANTSNF